MNYYLIAYDAAHGSSQVDQWIISFSDGCWRHLASTWVICHPGPAQVIRQQLEPLLPDSGLLIVECSGDLAWSGFDREGSSWLADNLSDHSAFVQRWMVTV